MSLTPESMLSAAIAQREKLRAEIDRLDARYVEEIDWAASRKEQVGKIWEDRWRAQEQFRACVKLITALTS